MSVKKSSTNGSIPATVLKQYVDVYPSFLPNAINCAITIKKLEKLEVIPLHKKENLLKKENYRPVSLLPHVSKVFERIIYKQINIYMQDKLSTYNWILKITSNTTFFNDHARKMEKCFR